MLHLLYFVISVTSLNDTLTNFITSHRYVTTNFNNFDACQNLHFCKQALLIDNNTIQAYAYFTISSINQLTSHSTLVTFVDSVGDSGIIKALNNALSLTEKEESKMPCTWSLIIDEDMDFNAQAIGLTNNECVPFQESMAITVLNHPDFTPIWGTYLTFGMHIVKILEFLIF